MRALKRCEHDSETVSDESGTLNKLEKHTVGQMRKQHAKDNSPEADVTVRYITGGHGKNEECREHDC